MFNSALKLALIEAGALTTEFCEILGLAGTFGDMVNCGPTAPTLVSIVAATQTSIVVTLNQSASGTENLGFTFDGTTSVTLASATGLPGNSITFNINETLFNDSNVLLSYSSVTGDIAGTVGSIDLASFSNSLVTVSGLPSQESTLLFHTPLISDLVDVVGGATPTFVRSTLATYLDDGTGLVTGVSANAPRFEAAGYLNEEQRTNNCIYSADLSNAAWVASNVTKSSDGVTLPDGNAGTAETLTASAGNGTLLQTITLASAANDFSVYLQRKTGTGNIDITLDNGVTWTTKALTGVGTWDRVDVTGVAAANPVVGVRLVTSGDAVQMWGAQLETGAFQTSCIPTTTVAATRDADELTYAYNLPALVGSFTAEFYPRMPAITNQYLIGINGSIRPCYTVGTGGSIRLFDGANALIYTATGWQSGSTVKIGLAYEDGAATESRLYANGSETATGSFVAGGWLQLGAIGIGNRGDNPVGIPTCTIKNVKIYTDAKDQTFMEAATT